MMQNYVEETVDIEDKARAELGLIENVGFEPVPEEETPEEAKARADAVAARKAEAYKVKKLKPVDEA